VKKKLVLPSKIESIDEAVSTAINFAAEIGFGEDAVFPIDLAVREVVANAIKHGNKFDETKRVEITLDENNEGFEITVRDFGEGFAVEEVPDPTNPENLLKTSGRGILFMNNFMDKVEWFQAETGGTIVKMLKKR
jgi:serine/threonine-protein kinase RsbW